MAFLIQNTVPKERTPPQSAQVKRNGPTIQLQYLDRNNDQHRLCFFLNQESKNVCCASSNQLAKAATFPRAFYSPGELLMLMHYEGSKKKIAPTFASVLLVDLVEAIAQIGSSRKNEKKNQAPLSMCFVTSNEEENIYHKKAVAGGANSIPLSSEGNVLLASWCCFPHSSWHRRGWWFSKEG